MQPHTNAWNDCKNLLVIRPDNMGDLLMSMPAIRALKQTFNCRITLLTSTMAAPVVPYLPEIDEAIIFNLPWVKISDTNGAGTIEQLIENLRQYAFDAAIVFTVCSQNPMPSIMLAYMAGIPQRLAYCRENPYNLLTHWLPDKEPYNHIKHQVLRDTDLVASIGAINNNNHLSFKLPEGSWYKAADKLVAAGVDVKKPWLILHAPVSEKKREYDTQKWIEAACLIRDELNMQLVLTGTKDEWELVNTIQQAIGKNAFTMAGVLMLDEFMAAIQNTHLVLSVNTATIHFAAAAGTPVVVLYACTNPQHVPWKVLSKVLYFPVPAELKSKNQVVMYLQSAFENPDITYPTPTDILEAARRLLNS